MLYATIREGMIRRLLASPPEGSRWQTKAQDLCAQVEPKMRRAGMGHYVACHFPLIDADEVPVGAVQTRKASSDGGPAATSKGIA